MRLVAFIFVAALVATPLAMGQGSIHPIHVVNHSVNSVPPIVMGDVYQGSMTTGVGSNWPSQAGCNSGTRYNSGTNCNSGCNNNCGGRRSFGFGSCLQNMKNPLCPPESHAIPFGTATRCTLETQIMNGAAAQMIFYHYDFAFDNSSRSWKLSALGHRHVDRVIRLMQFTSGQIMVQATPDLNINETRRQIVGQAMMSKGAQISADQIVVGYPPVRGLSGLEAEAIYARSLEPTQLRSGSFGNFDIGSAGTSPESSAPTGR